MSYEDTFCSIFGDNLPVGHSAFALHLPYNNENPISYITKYIGEEGGKIIIKSRMYYICSTLCSHPEAIKLKIK